MSVLSTFIVNPELSVVCFRRDNCKNGPFFAVREFDIKVIRSRDKGRRGRGPSEQAIRASIRQAVLNMNLKSERASKSEIRQLKGHGILGKRAPSCSLLCAEDMCRLLEAFGKDSCVRDLRSALAKDRKSEDIERKSKGNERNSLPKRKSVASLSPHSLQTFESNDEKLFPVNPTSKRPKFVDLPSNRPKSKSFIECPILTNKPLTQDTQLELQSQFAIMSDSNGLDALYSALLAFSDSTDPINTTTSNSNSFSTSLTQEMENNSAEKSPIYSIPSPVISPTTSPSTSPSREPWCFASPQSPSSPFSDSTLTQRSPSRLPSLSSPDNYMPSEEEQQLSPKGLDGPLPPLSPLPLPCLSSTPWNLSFSHPTVLRPRKKKGVKSRLAAEISSLSSDIIAKLIADQSK
jgi:hypothetical protein